MNTPDQTTMLKHLFFLKMSLSSTLLKFFLSVTNVDNLNMGNQRFLHSFAVMVNKLDHKLHTPFLSPY